MDPKYRPGDIVFKYDIGELSCKIEQYEITSEGECSPAFLYPFFYYKTRKKGDTSDHTVAEGALYPTEDAALKAMIQELESNKLGCEHKILQAARIIAQAQEDLDHYEYLLTLYDPEESPK